MSAIRRKNRVLVLVLAAAAGAAIAAGCSGDAAKKHPVPNGGAGEGGAGGEAGSPASSGTSGAGESSGGGQDASIGASAGQGGEGGELGASEVMAGGAEAGASASAEAGASGAAGSGCDALASGSSVVIELDSLNAERVTNLRWIRSDSSTTPNLAAEGGPLHCADPVEYFGQAYGAEGTLPAPVVAGNLATVEGCGLDFTITAAAADCAAVAQVPVTTAYHLYTGAQKNQLRVTRTFGFAAGATAYPQTILRPYVPRVPVATFSSVIYPNQANTAVTTGNPGVCALDCLVPTGTTWSGRWYADIDPTTGLALIVLRDPGATSAVSLAINNDGFSASNLSSFLLLGPNGGWQTALTETEYLCFADLQSWPQAERDAATLPVGCGP